MPTDPPPKPPKADDDTATDAVHQLLDALREPGAIDCGLAAHLIRQLQDYLDQESSGPAPQDS